MIYREDSLVSFTEKLLYEGTWHPFMFLHFDYYLPIPHSHYVVGGAHHLEEVNFMWDHLLQPLVWNIRTYSEITRINFTLS